MRITRKAILIGSPGRGNSFLQGVDSDLKNFRKYLLSEKGGKWSESEITTLQDPDSNRVASVVNSIRADYTFIYFSGHGWTNNADERMLSLHDKSIPDTLLLNNCPKQLIIIDACRNYIVPGISGVPDFGEEWDSFDGYYEAREMFDQFIKNSPKGKTIIHATEIGKYSFDSPWGGHFTQALLRIATQVNRTQMYRPIMIEELIKEVPSFLKKKMNFQIPTKYSNGALQIPFAIGIPERRLQTLSEDKSNGGLVLLGLGLLFIGIVAANSK